MIVFVLSSWHICKHDNDNIPTGNFAKIYEFKIVEHYYSYATL